MMKQRNNKKWPGLLPRYFKYVGIVIILLVLPAPWVIKAFVQEISPAAGEIFKNTALSLSVLGLFFIAFGRDKHEDEMTYSFRLSSIMMGFLFAIFIVISIPIWEYLDIGGSWGVHRVLGSALLFCILSYHLLKSRAKTVVDEDEKHD